MRPVVKLFVLFSFAFLINAPGCSIFFSDSRPSVVIVSPPSGSQFYQDEEIAVQSEASDPTGIVRVELVVDDKVVRADAPTAADNKTAFLLNQIWRGTPGKHVLLVRAYNAAGSVSNPAAIAVSILPGAAPTATAAPTSVFPTAAVSASPTITPTLSAGCSDSAVFVADVTVPDGTPWAAGQTFNKIWRVRNTGCPWGAGYQLVFVSGEAMATTRAIPLPETATGATADLLVAMTAPIAPGAHNGTWRLRNPSGVLFGTIVTVKINVLGQASATKAPAPVACNGTPVMSTFSASKTIVTALSTTTLSWGPVTNADWVELNPDIGGVATPGSATVAVTTTTTFTLLAFCGPSTSTNLQVRVLVPFAVIGSTTGADTTDYSGACPKTVNFSGVITANDAGPVTYRWENSDGSSSGDVTINFSGAGSQTVTSAWMLGTPGKTFSDYWRRLHISSPTDVTSNNATFTLRCN